MASFNSTLHLDGQEYDVAHCSYEFTQATDPRGRATTKVRSGFITLTLPVPESDALVAWAADPHKKLSGQVSFDNIDKPVQHEEVSFEEGICVAYEEIFAPDVQGGPPSYFCTLRIAASTLTMGTAAKSNVWADSR